MPDLLHVFNLGVARDVIGSILKVVLKERHVFRGSNIEDRMSDATMKLKAWAKSHKLPLRLRKFSKAKLSWKGKTYPSLASSRYDAYVCMRWLQDELADHQANYPSIFCLIWSANVFVGLLNKSGWFLSEREHEQVKVIGTVFCQTLIRLAGEALENREVLWHIRPKLHMLFHGQAQDEDYLKKVGKTLRLTDARTAQKRVLQRWLLSVPKTLQKARLG